MKLSRRHKSRSLLGWKTTVVAVLAFLCLFPDPALSQKANLIDEKAGVESSSSNIRMRSSLGQPLTGRMSAGSIRGFAGLLYRISQPPRIESVPPTTVLEDSLYGYQVTASDANGDSIFYSIVEGPAGMQVTASGEILWTPTQNEVGSNDVMLAVYDARGDSSFQSWSIEVTNINDPPEIALPDTLASLPEDSSVVISFVSFISDVDNGLDDLILSAEIIGSEGFESANGQPSGFGFMGKKDIEAEFSELRFDLFKASAFDEPGFRSMGVSVSTSSLVISIDDSAKSVTLSGMPDSSGVFRVIFSVSDPDSFTASDTTVVLIVPRNDAPVVSDIPDISFLEDSTFTIDLDAFVFDVDNDTSELNWSVELAEGDSGAVLANRRGDLGRNLKRADSVTISGNRRSTIVRGKARTDSAKLINSNSEANHNKGTAVRKTWEFAQIAPEPAEDEEIIVELRKISGMKSVITMSSQSGELLDSVIISIDSTSHIATFTTTANYFAADIQIIFTATDPDGLADSDSSLLTIEPVNDAPELSALPDIVFNEDDTLVVNFADWFDFVIDPDNPDSTLSWSVTTTDSDSVNVIIQGDSVLFTAPQDWFAFDRDTLIVTVTDSALESSVRLAVHVLPVNDAPSLDFIPDTLSFGNDTSLVMSFDSIIVDVDDPDSLLTWFAVFSDSGSDTLIFFDILGDSALRISSVPGWIGEDTLTIVVVDTSGERDSAIVLIRVTAPVSVEDHIGVLPLKFEVFQNYPNPFNPTTTIRYALPKRSDVTIEIYNLMGQLVTRIHKEGVRAGYHEEIWNGVNSKGVPIASGVYIYRLRAGEYVRTKKMLLLR